MTERVITLAGFFLVHAWSRLRPGLIRFGGQGFPGARGTRLALCVTALAIGCGARAAVAGTDPLIASENRLVPDAPQWRELVERFARKADVVADFEERRMFPFRKEAIVLRGEVRVSSRHGLSLYYVAPQERLIIVDAQGMLLRDPGGGNAPPADPRANVANEALRHILLLDLAGLGKANDLYGRREGERWTLVVVPHDPGTRRAIGNIHVDGEGDTVRRIELRRSARQQIEIKMATPRPVKFTGDEAKRYFR